MTFKCRNCGHEIKFEGCWITGMSSVSSNDNFAEVSCGKFELWTHEELEARQKEIDEHIKKMFKAEPWINEKKKKYSKGGKGLEGCPLCGKKIMWVISSYNGHMHAICETSGCVNFCE